MTVTKNRIRKIVGRSTEPLTNWPLTEWLCNVNSFASLQDKDEVNEMQRLFRLARWFWPVAVVCLAIGADTKGGAASKDELASLYQRYFTGRRVDQLRTLVFWPGVRERERNSFNRSLDFDLKYQLASVALAPLDENQKLEYTIDRTLFRPTLTPVAKLVATYNGRGEVKTFSTSYMVGVRNNRYYITLASPIAK